MTCHFFVKLDTRLFTKTELLCVLVKFIYSHTSADFIEEIVTRIFKCRTDVLLTVSQFIFAPNPASRLIVGIEFINTLVLDNFVYIQITRFKCRNRRQRFKCRTRAVKSAYKPVPHRLCVIINQSFIILVKLRHIVCRIRCTCKQIACLYINDSNRTCVTVCTVLCFHTA